MTAVILDRSPVDCAERLTVLQNRIASDAQIAITGPLILEAINAIL